MNTGGPPAEYVLARRVLLDALDALGVHRDAVVLVGAQAVYLHTGNADLAVAPTTTDADIALAPDRLRDEPLLEETLRSSGFAPGNNPGMWCGAGGVAVDLMVPEALSGSGGRRGARLPVHGNRVARRTSGLEPALADNEQQSLTSLDSRDDRSHVIRVAGPAALLVAKVIKVEERSGQPQRLQPRTDLTSCACCRHSRPARSPTSSRAWPQTHSLVTSPAPRCRRSRTTDAIGTGRWQISRPEPSLVWPDPVTVVESLVALVDDLLVAYDHQAGG